MDAALKEATVFWFMSILKTRALIRHFLVGFIETEYSAVSSTLNVHPSFLRNHLL
ncbi:hypothetical protein ACE6H2_017857 [Prunus campanulata]